MSSAEIQMTYNYLEKKFKSSGVSIVLNEDVVFLKCFGDSREVRCKNGMFYIGDVEYKRLSGIHKELDKWIRKQSSLYDEQQRRSGYKAYLIENLFDILCRLTEMGVPYILTKDENGRYLSFELYEKHDINIDNPSINEHIDDMLNYYQSQLDEKKQKEINETIRDLKNRFCLKDIRNIKENL